MTEPEKLSSSAGTESRHVSLGSISIPAAAVLTLVSGLGGAVINGYFNREIQKSESEAVVGAAQTKASGEIELERLKFETSLVLKALDTPTQPDAVKRLNFFAKAGLIPHYKKGILDFAKSEGNAAIPTITNTELGQGVPAEPVSGRFLPISETIVQLQKDGRPFCTGALVSPWNVLTVAHCAEYAQSGVEREKLTVRMGTFPSRIVSVKKVDALVSDKFALLSLEGEPASDARFLDLTKAMDPVGGESLFVIHLYAPERSLVVSKAGCVASGEWDERGFTYKCPTAYGSGGAIVFAEEDQAPLGIVYRFDPELKEYSDIAIRLAPLVKSIANAAHVAATP